MIDFVQGLQRVGTVVVGAEAIHRFTHQAKVRLETAAGLIADARFVAVEFIDDDLGHYQLDFASGDQIFERADNRLLAIILCEVQPDTCINQQPEHRNRLSRSRTVSTALQAKPNETCVAALP